MVPFEQRNTATIGFVGFAIIATMLFVAFRADKLPLVGGGSVYHAEFSEIGALVAGDEVRISGITVGKVESMELDGDKVIVNFRMKTDAKIGDKSTAAVKVRTVLGASYVGIDPKGAGDLPKGGTIPVERTVPPYDVVQAFTELSDVTAELDLTQVAGAIKTVGQIAAESGTQFQGAIQGLSDVSTTLASRDAQINQLLTSLDRASKVLSSRSGQIETLLKDSNQLFAAVAARRDSIHTLFQSASAISTELRALVKESRADLKPALDQMVAITDMLARNDAALDESLRMAPAFYGAFSDALGSGPWFDVYVGLGGGA